MCCVFVFCQVERGLQSQLAHSEEEVHRLMEQLAVMEATLREERTSHSSERENLMLVCSVCVYNCMQIQWNPLYGAEESVLPSEVSGG